MAPEHEQEFLDWQRRVFRAESRFPGFRGHRLERPVPGIQERWALAITFETSEELNHWLDSPDRKRLLEEARGIQADLRVRKASHGFDFWFQGQRSSDVDEVPLFKGNLLVLLVLYPLVFVWAHYVSRPYVDARGVPEWLSLFVGNLVTTQLLGWWLVPRAFRLFHWWLAPQPSWRTQVAGYALLVLLYGMSMAAYAFILARA